MDLVISNSCFSINKNKSSVLNTFDSNYWFARYTVETIELLFPRPQS